MWLQILFYLPQSKTDDFEVNSQEAPKIIAKACNDIIPQSLYTSDIN